MGIDAGTSERDRVMKLIYAAFKDVTRDGGRSWSDSWEADGGPASDCPLYPDRDVNWKELIDDARWEPSAGWGGFSFLDAVGFAYYLPAALVRCIRDGHDSGVVFHLYHRSRRGSRIEEDPRKRLLSQEQLRCIVAVANFMAAVAIETNDDMALNEWMWAIDVISPAIKDLK